jgi:hypothetical protein
MIKQRRSGACYVNRLTTQVTFQRSALVTKFRGESATLEMAAAAGEHCLSAHVPRLSEFQSFFYTSNNTSHYQSDATEWYALQLCFVISSACFAPFCLDNVVCWTLYLLSVNIPYFHFNCSFTVDNWIMRLFVCILFIAQFTFLQTTILRFVSYSFYNLLY